MNLSDSHPSLCIHMAGAIEGWNSAPDDEQDCCPEAK
jgi:hypothetical protein